MNKNTASAYFAKAGMTNEKKVFVTFVDRLQEASEGNPQLKTS
jgi:hypothetical protein